MNTHILTPQRRKVNGLGKRSLTLKLSLFSPPKLSTDAKKVPSPFGRRCHEVADEGHGIVSSENKIPHPALSQANQPAQKRAGRRRDETWFSGLVLKINPPWPRLSDSVAPGAGLSETGPFFKGGKEHGPKGIPPFTKKGG